MRAIKRTILVHPLHSSNRMAYRSKDTTSQLLESPPRYSDAPAEAYLDRQSPSRSSESVPIIVGLLR